MKEWRLKNRDAVNIRHKKWYWDNIKHARKQHRDIMREWVKNNPENEKAYREYEKR